MIFKEGSGALAASNKGLLRIISAIIGMIVILSLLALGKIAFFVATGVIYLICVIELSNLLNNIKNKFGYLVIGSLYLTLIFSLNAMLFLPFGRMFVLFTLIGTWVFDSAAYYVGSKWGSHKLVPNISPNKSLEGLIAGIAAVAVISVLLPDFVLLKGLAMDSSTGIIALKRVIWVIFICFGAFAGDLLESWFKRKIGVKDSSQAIPGHGGFLDRFDSLFLTAFLSFIFFWWIA